MILSMAVVMIPMHIRFVVCGELTIPHLGLIYYCFYKRKIAMRNLGRPSRSDFVQHDLYRQENYTDIMLEPAIHCNPQKNVGIVFAYKRYKDFAISFLFQFFSAFSPLGFAFSIALERVSSVTKA